MRRKIRGPLAAAGNVPERAAEEEDLAPEDLSGQQSDAGWARVFATLGGLVSVSLTAYAGRRNPSALLILLFCGWALTPFAAALWLAAKARPSVIALLAIADAAIYTAQVLGMLPAKMGFIFLVVPLLSWGLLAIAVRPGRGPMA